MAKLLRRCVVCRSRKRRAVDRAIFAGEPVRAVARRTGLGRSAIMRHLPHVAGSLARAQRADEDVDGRTLLGRVNRVYVRLELALERAEREGDLRAVIVALREMRETVKTHVEMLARSPGARGPVEIRVRYDQTRDERDPMTGELRAPRELPRLVERTAEPEVIQAEVVEPRTIDVEAAPEPGSYPGPRARYPDRFAEKGVAEPAPVAYAGFDAEGNPGIIWRRR